MKRKLQIFVSSTYSDLLIERQAAVEAILRAGHIPAGMELFASGDKSQLETISRWIDESDVYMLILAGRYGSIEPASGKSYTQIEYEYALSKGKRFFAIVLSDNAIEGKVKALGRNALEAEHPKELQAFRQVVTSKICRFADDSKDIKLIVHETLLEFLREYSFDGWVSGKALPNLESSTAEIARLTQENRELRAELELVRATKRTAEEQPDFDAIIKLLKDEQETFENSEGEPVQRSVLSWFYGFGNLFVSGLSNTYNMDAFSNFLFFRVGPHLSIHGLTEDRKVSGAQWRTLKTTKKGNDLLVFLKKRAARNKEAASKVTVGQTSTQPVGSNAPNESKASPDEMRDEVKSRSKSRGSSARSKGSKAGALKRKRANPTQR